MGKSSISIKKIGVTKLDVDIVVNAANSGLWKGGGVSGAIFDEAGTKELTEACNVYGHCDEGNAVITPGFKLKAKYIIHAVGPRWVDGEHKEPQKLYGAYMNSLKLAKENDCHSIGFPLISAGIFGYPKHKAWRKAIQACQDFINANENYNIDIIFAVLSDNIFEIGIETLDEIAPELGNRRISNFDDLLTRELDANAKKFFTQNLNLLKALHNDNELKGWLEKISPYDKIEEHIGLKNTLDELFYQEAYEKGLIIKQYGEIADALDKDQIGNPSSEWIKTLSKIQIIACVAYHFRVDHFNEGSLYRNSVADGLLIPYFEEYLSSKWDK